MSSPWWSTAPGGAATVLNDVDRLPLEQGAAGHTVSVALLKSTFKTYFDGIYAAAGGGTTFAALTDDPYDNTLLAEALDDKLGVDSLSATLTLYPTTAASDIPGYSKIVSSVTDPSYDTVAVDVPTGPITGANQLLASLAASPGLIIGNPGVVNITIAGSIRRLTGTGTATFAFRVFHRDALGVETDLGVSGNTVPASSGTYIQYSAALLLNNGDWAATDIPVVKFYGTRIAGGSDPSYEFRFGGTSPVRILMPVPVSVIGHNHLAGIQGGSETERYHLTAAQHGDLHAPGSDNQVADGVTITGTGLPESPFVATGGSGVINGACGELEIVGESNALASSVTVTNGTITAGDYTSTHTINQTYLTVQETGKFLVDFTFTVVADPGRVRFQGRYQGSSAHEVEVKFYNYVTLAWDDALATTKDIPHSTVDVELRFAYPADSSMYRSGGECKVRIEHVSNSVSTHYLYVDFISVVQKAISLVVPGTYYPFTGLSVGKTTDMTVDGSAGTMTIVSGGTYDIKATASWGGTPLTAFKAAVFNNGVMIPSMCLRRRTDATGSVDETSLSGLVDLVPGDVLSFRIAAESPNVWGFADCFNWSITRYFGALANLSAVTNDAQLKRAAGDFATFDEKTTLVDADINLIEDSAAGGAKKKVTWANIKATLKTYLDAIFQPINQPVFGHGTISNNTDNEAARTFSPTYGSGSFPLHTLTTAGGHTWIFSGFTLEQGEISVKVTVSSGTPTIALPVAATIAVDSPQTLTTMATGVYLVEVVSFDAGTTYEVFVGRVS